MAIERKVRCIRGSGTAALEDVWETMAAQGWRLVSSASAAASPIDVMVWMFFERDVPEE